MQCQPVEPGSAIMSDRKTIAIVGCSVRALVQSARRGGLACVGFDRFGDWDARLVCPMARITQWSAIPEHPQARCVTDWILAGDLECHPETVRTLDARWSRIGIGWHNLARCRDLETICDVANQSGLLTPEWQHTPPADPAGWLRKPMIGAGGVGIDWARSPSAAAPSLASPVVFQKFVPGQAISILYLTRGRSTHYVGACYQLLGRDVPGSPTPFGFLGAIGPIPLPNKLKHRTDTFGERWADVVGLQGLWGIDAVWDASGELHLIEINPRPTATVDVYESAGMCQSLISEHLRGDSGNEGVPDFGSPRRLVAKQVLFWAERHPLTVDNALHRWLVRHSASQAGRWITDIPRPGVTIGRSQPFVTAWIACSRHASESLPHARTPGGLMGSWDAPCRYAKRRLDGWIHTIWDEVFRGKSPRR